MELHKISAIRDSTETERTLSMNRTSRTTRQLDATSTAPPQPAQVARVARPAVHAVLHDAVLGAPAQHDLVREVVPRRDLRRVWSTRPNTPLPGVTRLVTWTILAVAPGCQVSLDWSRGPYHLSSIEPWFGRHSRVSAQDWLHGPYRIGCTDHTGCHRLNVFWQKCVCKMK
jgi:hypothetical protein